jgi:hypothetical protein
MSKVHAVMLLLTLSGCAQQQVQWVNYSNPSADIAVDWNGCVDQGNLAVRQRVAGAPDYGGERAYISIPNTYSTSCTQSGNQTDCRTTSNGAADSVALLRAQQTERAVKRAQQKADEQTSQDRKNFFNSCMAARGWALQSVGR